MHSQSHISQELDVLKMPVQTGLGDVGIWAGVGLLLAMYPDHVLFEVDTLRELILTNVASVRLLHLVHALVGSQVGGRGEFLLAICTSKRFEVGVD